MGFEEMFDFKALNDIICELGEGPIYDARRDALWYCDILGCKLYKADLGSGVTQSWSFPSEVGSIGVCESGRIVMALRDQVGIFDPGTEAFDELARIEADSPGTRLNDGKVGPDGAFWVGTMDDRGLEKREPIGALYRVDASGKVEKKVGELRVSNGLAFSPDGRTMYHADTGAPRIDRWDLDPDTGAISNRRKIAEPGDSIGRPDGAATDADGNYWSAGISAGQLNKFTSDGVLLDSYPLPVGAPTMPCFGGKDLRKVFVTSLRVGRAPELLQRFPLTGTTIVSDGPVAGAPVGLFRDVS
jgi:sugar lactone lactonase YvrE